MSELVGQPIWIFVLLCMLVFLAFATLLITRRLSSVIGGGLPRKNSPPLADVMPRGTSFAPDHVDDASQPRVRRLKT